MPRSINTQVIETKYNNSFTLLEAINDPLISENVEKFYVPQVEIRSGIFIKKDESIAVTPVGPKRIKFIYLNPKGKNITNPEASYIQILPNCKGFLARLSISRNNFTPTNLEMDYIIDMSNIQYKIDAEISRDSDNIVMQDIIRFKNIDFNDYPNIEFDTNIKEFILHKEDLFEMYFK